jgi:hypothetical protein
VLDRRSGRSGKQVPLYILVVATLNPFNLTNPPSPFVSEFQISLESPWTSRERVSSRKMDRDRDRIRERNAEARQGGNDDSGGGVLGSVPRASPGNLGEKGEGSIFTSDKTLGWIERTTPIAEERHHRRRRDAQQTNDERRRTTYRGLIDLSCKRS